MAAPTRKLCTGFNLALEQIRRISSAIAPNVADDDRAYYIVRSAAKLEGYNMVSALFPLPDEPAQTMFLFCIYDALIYVSAQELLERLPSAIDWLEKRGLHEISQMPLFSVICELEDLNTV